MTPDDLKRLEEIYSCFDELFRRADVSFSVRVECRKELNWLIAKVRELEKEIEIERNLRREERKLYY